MTDLYVEHLSQRQLRSETSSFDGTLQNKVSTSTVHQVPIMGLFCQGILSMNSKQLIFILGFFLKVHSNEFSNACDQLWGETLNGNGATQLLSLSLYMPWFIIYAEYTLTLTP